MSVDLRFDEYDIDEEDDKVMFDVLVGELFAFVLMIRDGMKLENTH
jgi:hypothetical protein